MCKKGLMVKQNKSKQNKLVKIKHVIKFNEILCPLYLLSLWVW